MITRPEFTNEKHPNWKGDNVGNSCLHKWIHRHFLKPEKCEFCNEVKRLDLANITGVYNRDFSNWKYLCRKCHLCFDNVYEKMWKTRHSKFNDT